MFQVPMSLHMASSVCKNFMLTPLTITDLSPYFKAPFPGFSLILNFEIVTRNERLTCILKGVIIPEQRCLDEIQHVTQPDVDFPVQQDLKREIIKNTTSGSTYIVMDNDKFKLTSSHTAYLHVQARLRFLLQTISRGCMTISFRKWPTFSCISSILSN
jgi:hypothetical protein